VPFAEALTRHPTGRLNLIAAQRIRGGNLVSTWNLLQPKRSRHQSVLRPIQSILSDLIRAVPQHISLNRLDRLTGILRRQRSLILLSQRDPLHSLEAHIQVVVISQFHTRHLKCRNHNGDNTQTDFVGPVAAPENVSVLGGAGTLR